MSNTFVPWWGDKEVVTEYVAPGIRYIRDAKTGELLAFIEGEEDDDMLDNPNEQTDKITINQKERVMKNALPMEIFKMSSFQERNWKTSNRQSLTGRITLNVYPATWLPPENNTRTMQPPSSAGQGKTVLLPGREITKARNMKHYEKIYRRIYKSV